MSNQQTEQFDTLLNYLHHLRSRFASNHAVLFDLTSINNEELRSHYAHVIMRMIIDLARAYQGHLFMSKRGLIMLVIRDLGVGALEKRIDVLSNILSRDDDFLVLCNASSFRSMYRMHDFKNGFDVFLRDLISIEAPEQIKEHGTKRFVNEVEGEFGQFPINLKQIARIDEFIPTINLNTYVVTRPAYGFFSDGVPQKLFTHLSVDEQRLVSTLLPNTSIKTKESLIASIYDLCQKRLLRLLATKSLNFGSQSTALHVNYDMVTSLEFISYHIGQRWDEDTFLVVSFDVMSVVSNVPQFAISKEFCRQKGMIVALSNVDLYKLQYIQVELFDFDFMFFNVPNDITSIDDKRAHIIRNLILSIGADKVVFNNCDDEATLTILLELGALIIMGRKMENLVRMYARKISE